MRAQCSQVDVEELMFIVPPFFQWSNPFQHLRFLEGFKTMFFLLANLNCVAKKTWNFFGGFSVNSKNIPQKMAKNVNLLIPKIGNTQKTLLKKFLNH
jgi:hypothetical protein